jgi:hypothetical protein
MSKDPDPSAEPERPSNHAPSSPGLTAGLVALFLLAIGCGLLVGNVFENYENGSNL